MAVKGVVNKFGGSKSIVKLSSSNLMHNCHCQYCSALDSRFTVVDVCFIVGYSHSYRALRRVAAWDQCIDRTCTKNLLV